MRTAAKTIFIALLLLGRLIVLPIRHVGSQATTHSGNFHMVCFKSCEATFLSADLWNKKVGAGIKQKENRDRAKEFLSSIRERKHWRSFLTQ